MGGRKDGWMERWMDWLIDWLFGCLVVMGEGSKEEGGGRG